MEKTEKMCPDCSKGRKEKWQKENKNKKIEIKDFVKLAISDSKIVEHMWFEVVFITYNSKNNKIEYIGRCDNIPAVLSNIKINQLYNFIFEDIEDYVPRRNCKQYG